MWLIRPLSSSHCLTLSLYKAIPWYSNRSTDPSQIRRRKKDDVSTNMRPQGCDEAAPNKRPSAVALQLINSQTANSPRHNSRSLSQFHGVSIDASSITLNLCEPSPLDQAVCTSRAIRLICALSHTIPRHPRTILRTRLPMSHTTR